MSHVILNHFDLNLLVVLDALLTDRSVTRAAERLQMTQPATSAALARIRRQLDDPILVRDGRTLSPTAYAESLAGPVRDMLANLEVALGSPPGFDPTTDSRVFRIAASDYAALVAVRPLLARIQATAPQIRLHVTTVSKLVPQLLMRDELDLVIAPLEVWEFPAPIHNEVLFRDDFVVAAWSGNPEVGSAITGEDFSRLPQLGYAQLGVVNFAESQLEALGIERTIEMTTQSFALAPFLIRGTRMIALIQRLLAAEVGEAAELRVVEAPFVIRPITEAVWWHPRRDDDAGHAWIRSELRSLFAEHNSE